MFPWKTYLGGSSPEICQYVQVPAITNEACNDAYDSVITDSMICAGNLTFGGVDACQGKVFCNPPIFTRTDLKILHGGNLAKIPK